MYTMFYAVYKIDYKTVPYLNTRKNKQTKKQTNNIQLASYYQTTATMDIVKIMCSASKPSFKYIKWWVCLKLICKQTLVDTDWQ